MSRNREEKVPRYVGAKFHLELVLNRPVLAAFLRAIENHQLFDRLLFSLIIDFQAQIYSSFSIAVGT